MDRIYYQTLTVPAGFGILVFNSIPWPLEDNLLKEITLEVPDGHCGLTGVRVLRANQQIVPFANNTYLIANDRTFVFPFEDEITASGLSIQGYNSDIFKHTFYLTATVANIPLPSELPPAEVTTAAATSDNSLISPDYLSVDSILSGEAAPTEPVTVPSLPEQGAPIHVPAKPAHKAPVRRKPVLKEPITRRGRY